MPACQLQPTQSLRDLLSDTSSAPDTPVSGIASDSRQVAAGFLFLAVQGIGSHGLDYVAEAVANGAVAVAWDATTGVEPRHKPVPMIAVPDLGRQLGEIANRFFDSPSAALDVVGVTGTNGKTTVAWIISQCLQRLDKRCAYIGTLGIGLDKIHGADGMTTPSTVELHGHLSDFVAQGATHAAMEVSSHALSQERVAGIRFRSVLFTNLTRDHLDYHGDMQTYFDSKAKLFLASGACTKIINLDSEYGMRLAELCGQDVVTVSTRFDRVTNGRPFVFVRSVVATSDGSEVAFTSAWGDGDFTLPMVGDFNVANAVLALAYLLQAGFDREACCAALDVIAAPAGRMQRVVANGAAVYIDYAHTPDALQSALRALRPHCRGRLWCVFGCGGDRDTGKRSQMGACAAKFSDQVVITNDNPRSESPQQIVGNILSGINDPQRATVIEDRAAAIAWTVQQAAAEDVVLIAGKGHESYQQPGNRHTPLFDYSVALAALDAKECQG